MENQNIKTGIAKVGYAMITSYDDNSITYSKVKWLESELSGGREYSAEPNGELNEIYADSKAVYSVQQNNGYNINLTLLAVVDAISKDWFNYTIDSENKAVGEFANNQALPKFALILIDNTTSGDGETTIYTYCNVSGRPNKSGKTAENNFDPQYPQYTIASRPRITDDCVCWTIHDNNLFETLPEFIGATDTKATDIGG